MDHELKRGVGSSQAGRQMGKQACACCVWIYVGCVSNFKVAHMDIAIDAASVWVGVHARQVK